MASSLGSLQSGHYRATRVSSSSQMGIRSRPLQMREALRDPADTPIPTRPMLGTQRASQCWALVHLFPGQQGSAHIQPTTYFCK